jgi:hypothetical protein
MSADKHLKRPMRPLVMNKNYPSGIAIIGG